MPALAVSAAAQSSAPAPVITGTHPSVAIVTSRTSVYTLKLYGSNFWPSGPNDPNRWRVHMRRDGGAWSEFRTSSGNNTEETFSFPTQPWLAKAGRIEVRFTRDGIASNVYSLEVRATAPVLSSLTPEEIPLRNAADDAAFTVSLRGQYWQDPTTVYINGERQSNLYQNLFSGQESYKWPSALRKPGRYTVQLQTENGRSGVKYLTIVAPPTTVAAVTPRIPAAALKAPNTRLDARVRFQGSPPSSVEWRTDRTSWRAIAFGTNIRMDEANVSIPTLGIDGAGWIELRLKNVAGEGVARMDVDRSQLATNVPERRIGNPKIGEATAVGRAPGVVQPPPVTVPAGGVVRPPTGGVPAVSPGAVPAAAPAATPAANAPVQGIIVQGGRTNAPAQGIVVQGGRTNAPAQAPAAAGIIVQGGRTATPAPGAASGIIVQNGRTTVDAYRRNLQTRLGTNASRVTATMQGTTLVLTGTVPTEAAKQSAAQAATGVAGITTVRNDLRVAP